MASLETISEDAVVLGDEGVAVRATRDDSLVGQAARYAVVGGVAFFVDFASLWTLTEALHMHYLVAALVGFSFGMTINYVLSISWVFSRRMLSDRRIEFLLFAAIGIVGLALNEAVLWTLTDGARVHYLLSKLVATALVYVWNFAARRLLLFR